MRGKVAPQGLRNILIRITPAYAGKSYLATCQQAMREDHPRLCGEKIFTVLQYTGFPGSPPPMRGKVREYRSMKKKIRITPAYAGKSPWFLMSSDII